MNPPNSVVASDSIVPSKSLGLRSADELLVGERGGIDRDPSPCPITRLIREEMVRSLKPFHQLVNPILDKVDLVHGDRPLIHPIYFIQPYSMLFFVIRVQCQTFPSSIVCAEQVGKLLDVEGNRDGIRTFVPSFGDESHCGKVFIIFLIAGKLDVRFVSKVSILDREIRQSHSEPRR